MSFSPTDFRNHYPEFATMTDDQLNYLYGIQQAFYGNVINGMQEPALTIWQDMIVAHLAKLSTKQSVGRLSNGTEGSVNASWDYPSSPSAAWWLQTPYGSNIWMQILSRGGFTWYSGSRYSRY